MSCPTPSALQAYLDGSAAAGDKDAMRAHLASCADCRALVLALAPDTPAGNVPVDAAATTRPGSAPAGTGDQLARGELVGRYVVLNRLGAGGMGVVYAAYDPELDRKIALKIIRRGDGENEGDTAARELQERLVREAQAMARVAHPNVVAVYDVGRHAGQVFVAMELIDGETLAEWLRQPRPPRRTTAQIVDAFARAAQGLAAAHSAGLVHRDFKPNNVMLDRQGRVRVMDFGLARPTGTSESPAPLSSSSRLAHTLTRSGILVGTPAYMAPEQLARQAADARTDQFSFCVALYEALCGTRPFDGADTDELLQSIRAHKLQRPMRKVPAWLLRVVERGLDRDPAARWPTMDALVAALGRDPALARRRWLGGVGALLVLATLGVALQRRESGLCRVDEQELAGVWDAPRREAVRNAFLASKRPSAAGVADQVLRTLDAYTRGWLAARRSVCVATRVRGEQSEALLDLRMQCLDDRLDEVRALGDAITAARGPTLEHAVDATAALSAHDECVTLPPGGAPPLPADPAARATFGGLRRRLDDVVARAGLLDVKEALRGAEALAADPALAKFPTLAAEVALQRGGALRRFDKLDDARRQLAEAARLGLRTRDDRVVAQSWLTLAMIEGVNLDHLDAALDWEQLAEPLVDRLGHPLALEDQRLYVLTAINMVGHRLEPAEQAARAELALAERSWPRDDLRLAHPLDGLSNVLGEQGKLEEALALGQRAIAILQKNGVGETLFAASHEFNIGLTSINLNRPADGERSLRRAIAIYERQLPPEHPDVLMARYVLAGALVEQRRFDDAAALLHQLQPLAEKQRGELPFLGPEIDWLLGRVELAHGHDDAGLALLERSMAAQPEPGARAEAQLTLGKALWDSGRDRRRAVALVRAARGPLGMHPQSQRAADEWLAAHAGH